MTELIGSVYKIINTKNESVYVGSTRHTLRHRFLQHLKNHCNENRRGYKNKLYTSMRENGIAHFSICLLEMININTDEDNIKLLKLEQLWIDTLKSELNSQSAFTKYPRRSKELNHQYYKASKENQTEESKEKNKKYVKEWHTENKEHVKQYKAELCNKSPLVLCPCSIRQFKERNRASHNKSITHKKYMATLSN